MLAKITASLMLAALLTGAMPTPADAKAATAKSKPKLSAAEYFSKAMEANRFYPSENLYGQCLTANIKLLAFGLRDVRANLSFTKGEFESTEEFEARIQRAEARYNPHELVVCNYLDKNEDVTFEYDADKEVFSASYDTEFRADLDFKQTGSYRTKTRSGIPLTVKTYFSIDYMVDMQKSTGNGGEPCVSVRGGKAHFEVKVPRAEAERLKKYGKIAWIGKMQQPFFLESDSVSTASLSDPTEMSETKFSIYFAPRKLAIIDSFGKEYFSCNL